LKDSQLVLGKGEVMAVVALAMTQRQGTIRHTSSGVGWKEWNFHTICTTKDQAIPVNSQNAGIWQISHQRNSNWKAIHYRCIT